MKSFEKILKTISSKCSDQEKHFLKTLDNISKKFEPPEVNIFEIFPKQREHTYQYAMTFILNLKPESNYPFIQYLIKKVFERKKNIYRILPPLTEVSSNILSKKRNKTSAHKNRNDIIIWFQEHQKKPAAVIVIECKTKVYRISKTIKQQLNGYLSLYKKQKRVEFQGILISDNILADQKQLPKNWRHFSYSTLFGNKNIHKHIKTHKITGFTKEFIHCFQRGLNE